MVKANAYGHGSAVLSAAAGRCGVAALGVSSLEEGIALRESGIKDKILILGSIFPLENLVVAAEHGLTPTISSAQGLAELVRLGRKRRERLSFHLKIDTGMGRVGISPSSARVLIEKIAQRAEVRCEGIYTHFSCADCDREYTRRQRAAFLPVIEYAKNIGLRFAAHASNSAALLAGTISFFDMVRPGLILYGLLPFEGAEKKIKVSPVLSWKTRIVFLKKVPRGTPVSYGRTFSTGRRSLIATLPVGYADGYSRRLSNKADVLIRGRRCPVVGRVTMDMIMADVTGLPGATIGDEAALIGTQSGETITAEELAGRAGTINYEITCAISSRVPRIVV